jgi:hypothetical protein
MAIPGRDGGQGRVVPAPVRGRGGCQYTGGPFYLGVDQVLEPAGAGARLTMHWRGESRGFFKLAEPLIVRLTKRQAEAAGENLKSLLEEHVL